MSNNPFLRTSGADDVAPPIVSPETSPAPSSKHVSRRSQDFSAAPSSSGQHHKTHASRSSRDFSSNAEGRGHSHASTSSSPAHHKGHASRPSQDLAAHEKLVRKDSRARRTIPRDQIDDLDNILGSYHHEGPFDATLASRQIPGRAPIEATKYGNSLALLATPAEDLQHSLRTHEPLDGTSRHASGTMVGGRRYRYDEENLQRADDALHGQSYQDDEDEDNLGVLHDDMGELRQSSKLHKKHDVVELEESSHGVVEYLGGDDEEDEQGVSRASGGERKGGVMHGLKKRLSVRKH